MPSDKHEEAEMVTHTEGPWHTVPGDSVVHVVAQNERICATNRKRYYERHDETDVANARLIAAAPDMLAALKEAEAGLEFAGADKAIPEGDFVPAPTLSLRIVRTAIAKAEA